MYYTDSSDHRPVGQSCLVVEVYTSQRSRIVQNFTHCQEYQVQTYSAHQYSTKVTYHGTSVIQERSFFFPSRQDHFP